MRLRQPRNLPRPSEKILVVIRGEVVDVEHPAREDLVIEEAVLRLKVERSPFDRISRFRVGFVPGFPFLKSLHHNPPRLLSIEDLYIFRIFELIKRF